MEPDFPARLEAFLRRACGGGTVKVENLRRLTGGASRETWSLDLSTGGDAPETLPLILQRDTRGAAKAMSRTAEYRLLEAAVEAGVPAPEPVWLGDESLGGEFFLVRRVEGETLPRRLLRDERYAPARGRIPHQLAEILARIHRIPLTAPGLQALPRPPEGAVAAAAELDRYEQVFRGIAPESHPAFELAFRWLRAGLPARPVSPVLVHGDYRMGNVLCGPEEVRLILDWELAHAGDPMEDIGWLCVRSWRFGGARPVGGLGEREPFFSAYEAAGGPPVDRDRVRWWEAFGNLRWGIICISQAQAYLSGASKSVELASIGRRTAETEWELLRLIDG